MIATAALNVVVFALFAETLVAGLMAANCIHRFRNCLDRLPGFPRSALAPTSESAPKGIDHLGNAPGPLIHLDGSPQTIPTTPTQQRTKLTVSFSTLCNLLPISTHARYCVKRMALNSRIEMTVPSQPSVAILAVSASPRSHLIKLVFALWA